jgi:hypothetical protein
MADNDYNRILPRHVPTKSVPFHSTDFHAVLTGLKANAQGDWILTLKIDSGARQSVYRLDDAFNMILDVHIAGLRVSRRDESA